MLCKKNLIFNKFNGRCAYCGNKITYLNMHIDHINPLNRKVINAVKGSSSLDNLNPSCSSCNSSKSNLSIDDWRNELDKKTEILYKNNATFRILLNYKKVKVLKTQTVFYFERIKNE